MSSAAHVSVTNGTSGKGVLLARNVSSSTSYGFLIVNTDGANAIELLGLDPTTSARQTYGNGYTYAHGKEQVFILGPGEVIYAAAAPATTVVCQVFSWQSVDTTG